LIKETVMALTRRHNLTPSTDPASTTSYEYFRNELLKRIENDPLRVNKKALSVEVDSINHLAIGYGYDLQAREASESATTLTPFLAAGVVISATQIKYLEAFRTKTALNLPGDPLDKMIPTRVQVQAAWSNIALASEEKATALLNVVASANYEPKVPQSLIADSKERAAVVSAVYNLGGLAAMPSMKAALEADNRAEAWYELRYNTNAGASRSKGLAIRRYRESDLFGLYDDGTMSAEEKDAEAKETLRMYTKHRTKIDAEEKEFPPTVSSSAATLIAPARDLLIANYVTAKNLGVSIDRTWWSQLSQQPTRSPSRIGSIPPAAAG
jgi:GH24 family phage-related lysozyme (muramidase)